MVQVVPDSVQPDGQEYWGSFATSETVTPLSQVAS
jgi:hypothetical protein